MQTWSGTRGGGDVSAEEDATKRKSRVVKKRGGGQRDAGARWADAHVPLLAICLALTRIGFVGEKIISAFGWDSRYLQVGLGLGSVMSRANVTHARSGGFPLGVRDGKRARARRVSRRTSSTPTPCSRTTRPAASLRPTHRERPSRPGSHQPQAPTLLRDRAYRCRSAPKFC